MRCAGNDFIVHFPTVRSILCAFSSRKIKHSGPKLFTVRREYFPNYFLASLLITVACKTRPHIELCALCMRHWQLGSRLPTTVRGGAKSLNLKGSHRLHGRRTKLAENLRASPFNEVLSNDTTFNQIHLAGQYIEGV
jgi:hypothetical protein